MNSAQQLWWKQSRSDFTIFELLRGIGVHPCYTLHFLQMATEKLSKASFWNNNTPPALSHLGFASFLRRLGNTPSQRRPQIAALFSYGTFDGFQAWIRTAVPLARSIEQISPAVNQDGPNSEYPWPHAEPDEYPAGYQFVVWTELQRSQGRKMMRFVEQAIREFPQIADL